MAEAPTEPKAPSVVMDRRRTLGLVASFTIPLLDAPSSTAVTLEEVTPQIAEAPQLTKRSVQWVLQEVAMAKCAQSPRRGISQPEPHLQGSTSL